MIPLLMRFWHRTHFIVIFQLLILEFTLCLTAGKQNVGWYLFRNSRAWENDHLHIYSLWVQLTSNCKNDEPAFALQQHSSRWECRLLMPIWWDYIRPLTDSFSSSVILSFIRVIAKRVKLCLSYPALGGIVIYETGLVHSFSAEPQ